MEPGDFEGQQTPKGHPCIEKRSASLTELRGHFGEAAHDNSDACCGDKIGERALPAQIGGHNRGKAKDTAADNGIDHERSEAPAANGSYEVLWFACGAIDDPLSLLLCQFAPSRRAKTNRLFPEAMETHCLPSSW